MSDLKVIRLSTGEDIIGTVKTTLTNTIIVDKPAQIIITPKFDLVLIPFAPYASLEKGLELKKDHIMWMVDPMSDLASYYIQKSTGIVVPASATQTPNLKLTS